MCRTHLAVLFALSACSRDRPEGMPPTQSWQGVDPALDNAPLPPLRESPFPGGVDDPHAGMGGMMGGGGGRRNPHEGVPGAPPLTDDQMGGGAGGGGGGGMDVTQLGLNSPDPNRPIDPNRRITGTLQVTAAVAAKVAPGAVLFLMVRKPPSDGKPGTLIAVDRVAWKQPGQVFELTERNAMIEGAPDMIGELVVMARVDQDQDALTKQPGDVVGEARVKVPASGVVITLDSTIP